MPKDTRYFFDQDESCHWYMIPEKHRKEWDKWVGLDDDSEEDWDPPPYAEMLDGHPKWVTFTSPKEV